MIQPMGLRDAGHGLANVFPGAAAKVAARLSLPMAESMGSGTATLLGWMPNRFYPRAVENLTLAFPEMPAARRAAIARRAVAHYGREVGGLMKWFASANALSELPSICVNFAELVATIERDLGAGRGAIYVGAHFGNAQLLSGLCATVASVTSIGTDYHRRSHLSFVSEGRRRLGLHYIPENTPPLELLRALQRNELVTFLPDVQPRRNGGLWLPFFGKPACTTTFPASLARLTGCTLRPTFLVREGSRYRAILRDAIATPSHDEGEAGLGRAMLAWSAALEAEVRRRPEQWLWMSRRWRSMPETARPFAAPAEALGQAG
jgi:KDO2-lipid IV(A) lauroyltransferase